MNVVVNGEERGVPDRASLVDVVAATGAAPEGRGIAVAVDGQVVPRGRWGETALEEGQRIEIVKAVQGGSR